ncbi:hypothetical protein FJZ27_04305 [Candidatus Peribacteria bacterium]|nr:hypothetical protein [Candidatus Peribacteria bacterium]
MLLRVLVFGLLQGFAVLLAELHRYLGVHTDEAKYLLNIPYPHPPLMRWILETTDGWQHQEIFWRIVFASLLTQGTWFVWDMGRKLHKDQRVTLCGLWLFSGALLLQAGTLFMPTITAIETLFLCWILQRIEFLKRWSALIPLLWLEMLFVAYQGILFAPLIFVALRQSGIAPWQRWSAFLIPIGLLALYTPTNPLTIVATGSVSGMSMGMPLEESVARVLKLWVIGGSMALSVLGLYGMVKSKQYPLVLTLMLVTAYIFVGFRSFYAILFTPLLIAGLLSAPKLLKSSAFLLALQIAAGTAIFLYVPFPEYSSARSVGDALRVAGVHGDILIAGSFGHEWQYLMPGPVKRYRPDFTNDAAAIVCLDRCVAIDRQAWQRFPQTTEEVWVKIRD